MSQKKIQKVYAYITSPEGQLLVFEHVDFPEAGVQVPGGTVEVGESVDAAVIREAEEETGLSDLFMVKNWASPKGTCVHSVYPESTNGIIII
jgi:8-oxo-dGTP pyrophosphatase MutT (NUDIX family)